MLALDRAATSDEIAAAAKKFIEPLRKRYSSGVELIKDLEISGDGAGIPIPSDIMAGIFRRQAQRQAQPTSPAQSQQRNSDWSDAMRQAKAAGQQRDAERQARDEKFWREFVNKEQQHQGR